MYSPCQRLLIWLVLPLVFLLPETIQAQQGGKSSHTFIPKLKKATLLVVQYENENAYNDAIRKVITDSWTFTPYKFVTQAELEALISLAPKDYAMLVRDNSERSRHGNVSHLIRRNHLAIYPTTYGSHLSNYIGRMAIAQFEVANIDDYASYANFLPAFVQAMQDYVSFCYEKGVNHNNYEAILKEYHSHQLTKLADMTLFLIAETLPRKYTEQDWLKAYPHEVYVINQSTLPSLLAAGTENVAFLHMGPEMEAFWIIGIEKGEVFYSAKPEVYKAFAPKDLKELSDLIENPDKQKGGKLGKLLRKF